MRKAGINVCSGGIIGLGEKGEDRVGLIHEMSKMEEPPESFPVNALVPIPGTPLGENEVRAQSLRCRRSPSVDFFECGTARFHPRHAQDCGNCPHCFAHVRLIGSFPLGRDDVLDAHCTIAFLFSSIIRLAAGRTSYTESEQAMAFMAGANAIFTGERMLTTPTNGWDEDNALLSRWGLSGWGSFESEHLQAQGEKPGAVCKKANASAEEQKPQQQQQAQA